MYLRKFTFLFFIFISFEVFSQQTLIDSLEKKVKSDKEDTEGVSTLIELSKEYIGTGEYGKAMNYALRAKAISEKISFKNGIANSLNNIGIIHDDQGNYPLALEYYLKVLKIREDLKDEEAIGASMNNLGNIYFAQDNYPKAIEYHLLGLKIREKRGDIKGIGGSLNNLGIIEGFRKNYDKSLEYLFRALKIAEDRKDISGVAKSLNNIANIYDEQGNYQEALTNYERSLKMKEGLGNYPGVIIGLNNIANVYIKQQKFKKALDYSSRSLELAKKIGSLDDIKNANKSLSDIYTKIHQPEKALQHLNQYYIYKDSIFNKENTAQTVRTEMNYEFEKKQQAQKLEQEKKDAISAAEAKKNKVFLYSISLVLLLVIGFAIFVFKSSRKISYQKELLQSKNKEITDSINYAQRIQQAILPPDHHIKRHFPESFVFYKPKDIVAGDFYWMEENNGHIFIAAADCTGHGVPGAMVSVVCSNALNRVVKEFGLVEPGSILDKVNELVIETFERSESDVNDGMDISLCCIHLGTKQMKWAGANTPFRYIKNGKLVEIAANKQPIGKHEIRVPFLTHSLELEKEDCFYLFTDGYSDQFGGEKGKKMTSKRFKEVLHTIHPHDIAEQKLKLEKSFENWRGQSEQVDDVLVIGIRV